MLPEWQRTWCLLAKNDCATISDRYFPPIGDQFVIWKANGIVLQLREDTEFLISLLTDALVQDKVEFAEAIKECGFDLQLFLTKRHLEDMYSQVRFSSNDQIIQMVSVLLRTAVASHFLFVSNLFLCCTMIKS